MSSVAKNHMERLTLGSDESAVGQSNNMDIDGQSNEQDKTNKRKNTAKDLSGGPASWYGFHLKAVMRMLKCIYLIIYISLVFFFRDPYSSAVYVDELR